MIFFIIFGYTCSIGGYSSLGVVSLDCKGVIGYFFIFSCLVSGFMFTISVGYKCKGVPALVNP